jgi:hypothetical protein
MILERKITGPTELRGRSGDLSQVGGELLLYGDVWNLLVSS